MPQLAQHEIDSIAAGYAKAHYPPGYIAVRRSEITDPPGVYFMSLREGYVADAVAVGTLRPHDLPGDGGFFVSGVDGVVHAFGSGEMVQALSIAHHKAEKETLQAALRHLLTHRPKDVQPSSLARGVSGLARLVSKKLWQLWS